MRDRRSERYNGRMSITPPARINVDRITSDIVAINRFTETDPTQGYSRPTFSTPWADAREYVLREARNAGAEARNDAAGNLHLRHRSLGWETPAWLSGSHIDSVPTGGQYDGVMGIVAALEILRARPDLPLELVIFAEEEGTTFGLGLLGSRLWTGALPAVQTEQLVNRHGQTFAEAGNIYGVDPSALARRDTEAAGLERGRYRGMVEIHPEQGLSLWDSGVPVAAVDRINGRRQFELTFTGQGNHAGSTGMTGRRDALAGAAEMVLAVERLGKDLARQREYSVATTGVLSVFPNAANVIPGTVAMSVEARAQDDAVLDDAENGVRRDGAKIAEDRGLAVSVERSEAVLPSPLDDSVAMALQQASARDGEPIPIVPSGALHDAAIVAREIPTAMLFVASRDGISHNPQEYSRHEDIARAAQILADMIAEGR